MGVKAVRPFCDPADVDRVNAALVSYAAGDSIDVNRLCMALSPADDQAATARILKSLCLFSARLSDPCCPASHVEALNRLMSAAIYLDFRPCVEAAARKAAAVAEAEAEAAESAAILAEGMGLEGQDKDATKGVTFNPAHDEDKAPTPDLSLGSVLESATGDLLSPELLSAYTFFLENTVSADSAFVEDVLRACASQSFRLPVPEFSGVVDVACKVIGRVLKTYSYAEEIFLQIVSERYPHPVRPTSEHLSYARAVLAVANRPASSASLVHGLLSIVIEKAVIIDAMASDCDDEESPDRLKIDTVLREVLSFCDSWSEGSSDFIDVRLAAVVGATEKFVIPADAAANSPNIALHALSVCGRTSVLKVVERFRVFFFDPGMPHPIRTTYLCYSAALLTRSSRTTNKDILSWLKKLTRWIHMYICERRSKHTTVDVDVHHLFYSAVFALMCVISIRPTVLCSSKSGDIANSMRLLSIMRSDYNPLLVMPPSLVSSFAKAVAECGGMSFEDILAENMEKTLPTMTRHGNANKFFCFFPLHQKCSLPLSGALISSSYFKAERRRAGRNSIGQIGSLLSVEVLNSSRKRCRSPDAEPCSPPAAKRLRDTE